jgi:hypothetical protein
MWYVKKMTPSEKADDEKMKESIAAMYYGRDHYVWTE